MYFENWLSKIKSKGRYDKETGCFVWTGRRHKGGYGRVIWKGTEKLVHRVVYELLHGEIPDGFVLHHLCGHPACFNPDHLESLTQAEHLLRSDKTLPVKNKNKTHCAHGHSFSEKNTYLYKDGSRCCRICRDIARQRWRLKLKL